MLKLLHFFVVFSPNPPQFLNSFSQIMSNFLKINNKMNDLSAKKKKNWEKQMSSDGGSSMTVGRWYTQYQWRENSHIWYPCKKTHTVALKIVWSNLADELTLESWFVELNAFMILSCGGTIICT